MKKLEHSYDFVVIGGGLSGLMAAITAARGGLKVGLVQERPVLGGNCSKEIRVPPVGARCCNFAYSKETGLIEELLLDNLYNNPTGSPEGWHLILTQYAKMQKGLDCYLNTVVNKVEVDETQERILAVRGYTVGSETWHTFRAPFFADCTGDGTVGALAGAPFRMGCEATSEFNESLAPEQPQNHGMGASIQIRTRDAGRPIPFRKPEWVDYDLGDEDFGPHRKVCEEFLQQKGGFWWLEWGGHLDNIHETEQIRDGVLNIGYAVWDYLKNRSPIRDQIQNYELDWVGAIPGKRESRRLIGDHVLCQSDVETQGEFQDAVAYGGWGFDDHPKEGFFAKNYPSFHIYHAGPYNIPLRSLYSCKIHNLLFAGRNISVTHIGLSTTRIMLTCAQLGEAIGMTAVQCVHDNTLPRRLIDDGHIHEVQTALQRADHHIHSLPYEDPQNLAPKAKVITSTTLRSPDQEEGFDCVLLSTDRLWQFPVLTERLEKVGVLLNVTEDTTLEATLFQGAENGTTRPAEPLWTKSIDLKTALKQWVDLDIDIVITRPGWHFLKVKANEHIQVYYGQGAPVGVLGWDVRPHDPIRINEYSGWKVFRAAGAADIWNVDDGTTKVTTEDKHAGMIVNYYCFGLKPEQPVYSPDNLVNPWSRPTNLPNLWVSEPTDFERPEWVELCWDEPQILRSIHLLFDSALDFHLTSLWMSYNRNTIPSLVKDYRLLVLKDSGEWQELVSVQGNYQRHCVHDIEAVRTKAIRVEILDTNGLNRAQIYSIRVY